MLSSGLRENPVRILLIEDEARMLELLRKGLHESGCAVMTAGDGETGLEIAMSYEFDAIVLDVGLPRRDGFEVARALRSCNRATPILMLTARDAEDDIIRGLDLGADDYMTKPFSFAELVARLQSITRPLRGDTASRIGAGDLAIDTAKHQATRGGMHIDLSRAEFALLARLARSAGRCVSRRDLMGSIWGSSCDVSPGALDVLVNSLRSKIDVPFPSKLIGTVRGSGYMLRSEEPVAGGLRR
jgi:DNA-binding response OmpR family regulator